MDSPQVTVICYMSCDTVNQKVFFKPHMIVVLKFMSSDATKPIPRKNKTKLYVAVAVVVVIVAVSVIASSMILNNPQPAVLIKSGTTWQLNAGQYSHAGPFKLSGYSKITGAINVTGNNHTAYFTGDGLWFYIFTPFQYSAFVATYNPNNTANTGQDYVFFQNTFSEGNVISTNLSAGTYYFVFDNVDTYSAINVTAVIQFLSTPQ